MSTAEGRERVQRLRAAVNRTQVPIDLAPKSAYELQTRARVEELERTIAEMRSRINALLWAVVGAVIVGLVLQLGGWA